MGHLGFSSSTRDGTRASPHWDLEVLATGPWGVSLHWVSRLGNNSLWLSVLFSGFEVPFSESSFLFHERCNCLQLNHFISLLPICRILLSYSYQHIVWIGFLILAIQRGRGYLMIFFFGCVACRFLVPQPGIEFGPSVVKGWSPKHCAAG